MGVMYYITLLIYSFHMKYKIVTLEVEHIVKLTPYFL